MRLYCLLDSVNNRWSESVDKGQDCLGVEEDGRLAEFPGWGPPAAILVYLYYFDPPKLGQIHTYSIIMKNYLESRIHPKGADLRATCRNRISHA